MMKDAVDVLSEKIKELEAERDALKELNGELVEALKSVREVLDYLPVGRLGGCGDQYTGETWSCEDKLYDTINKVLNKAREITNE